jgi:glycosyltransferase involved in cell wall biosynthesis
LPVLASDIPANRQIPLPEFRFFSAEETEELSKKLTELFTRGISAEESLAQKKLLLEEFNWDRIAEKTFSIYRSLIV